MKRYLVLEDGTIYPGTGFGATTATVGELVFNTGMSGYQESITDQSYNGEILMFTYPLIGNYGINRDDHESIKPTCKGVVVHEVARRASNWRNAQSLDDYLKQNAIPGIMDIDTRAVTKHIRTKGAMKATIVDNVLPDTVDRLKVTALNRAVVAQSSTNNAYPNPATGPNVVVVDFGLKHSILRELAKRQCNLTVLPYNTTASEIMALNPDGVMLTNGPGDPKDIPGALEMIREVEKHVPLFGICLGHQLFALANGADTFKMKFGHRGFNHPVREIATGRIDFTSQNHGYAVDRDSLAQTDLLITHEEINDGTVEGLRHRDYAAFSVQYHPDAAPGPHDADHIFDEFIDLMAANQATQKGSQFNA
ncbi:carbamoyl phosphate synthase small subunit [Lactiplantibacillus plantarum]|uniref:carbamoyl phosphate synthase small subunit n=1 Tax=Lactiplantibacillus plantarum TaxID=1590 RepID=UPI00077DF54C|nr:carbamoyl phosphate synthase small subunit [Lactiplantibacillus plantarum]AXH05165.1 carbamoyl phosphate synthase small subunit [Lactiplantibacillus plantarum]KYK07194.1 carbamoyl-phosphate synthase small subunit [Lactiplantibacillus plantarum]MBO2711711.1 carbamoyl phosphate synthase small subunit [Lactiplantibacillus plantarum]MCT3205336.1 carbamoyl phosphate synthase small subunit [Lactiplantibacillus plantarum]MCT3218417.1 carbamoyl phosphate synthase small subunit [Lactiplantibacillus 